MDLKNCPFCGSTNVDVFTTKIGDEGWNTGCHDCDASGPYADGSKQDAIDAWNKRFCFSNAEAVVEVLMDYRKHTSGFPGNDYWSKRFEMAFENGCPCKFDPNGLLAEKDAYDWCPLHGKSR